MNNSRLIIEENIFLATMKLQQIHWEVVKENQANVILDHIDNLQNELTNIKESIQKLESKKI